MRRMIRSDEDCVSQAEGGEKEEDDSYIREHNRRGRLRWFMSVARCTPWRVPARKLINFRPNEQQRPYANSCHR